MSSIIMEVIHMYVSIAIKLLKYLTGFSMYSVSTFNKANVNSFRCDGLLAKENVGSRKGQYVRWCGIALLIKMPKAF